jgi:hypothetical protein
MRHRLIVIALFAAACASQSQRTIPELPGRMNVRVRLAGPVMEKPGNPLITARYFVSVANGTDLPLRVDSVEMEGSYLTSRTTNSYNVAIAPHAQETLTFAANGTIEGGTAGPVSREPAGGIRPPSPLPVGPPSMLIIINVTDANGARRETFEQAIAGR